MSEQKELFSKIALDNWYSNVSRVDKLLDTLTDGQLQEEIAPGRNRGIYLIGHLAAVHDRMLPLLGFEQQHYPQLDEPFITNPDKKENTAATASELKAQWKEVNDTLAKHFNSLTPDQWFQKHTSVSEEDFAKEPHRNRLNVLVSRTNHLSYHLGQLVFLKK